MNRIASRIKDDTHIRIARHAADRTVCLITDLHHRHGIAIRIYGVK